MIILPRKNTYHLALIGLPSSGKGMIGRILRDKAGYKHMPNDDVREKLFPGKKPWDLSSEEWLMLYNDVASARHLYLSNGQDVTTDSCPYNQDLRKVTLHVCPEIKEYMKSELKRYIISLNVNENELERRECSRGRTDEKSLEFRKWLSSSWEPVKSYTDELGEVPAFNYENNTRRDQELILKDLGNIMGFNLL